jgi:hypothetical protein
MSSAIPLLPLWALRTFTCFGLPFSPSSEADVQFRHWFKSPGYGFIPTRLWRWNRRSVSKRWHLNYRRRGITQKKTNDIGTAEVWNQEPEMFYWTALSVASVVNAAVMNMEYWRNDTDRLKMKYCHSTPSWMKVLLALPPNLKPNLSTSSHELQKYMFVNSSVICDVIIILFCSWNVHICYWDPFVSTE